MYAVHVHEAQHALAVADDLMSFHVKILSQNNLSFARFCIRIDHTTEDGASAFGCFNTVTVTGRYICAPHVDFPDISGFSNEV
jgi:hypothetical protein